MLNTRILYIFLIIISTVVGPFTAAQSYGDVDPSCKAKPVDDPLVRDRASTVTFPNGRKVTVVGHMHGERQIYKLVNLNEDGKLQKMSNAEFEELMSRILRENSESKFEMIVLDHARKDKEFFNKHRKDAEFIGFEGSQDTVNHNLPEFLNAYREVIRQFQIRRSKGLKTTERELQDVLLSGTNGHIIPYLENPELREILPLIGTEDQDAGSEHYNEKPIERLDSALQALIDVDEKHWENLSEKEKEEFSAAEGKAISKAVSESYKEVYFMNFESHAVIRAKINFLKGVDVPYLNEALKEFVEALENRINLNSMRDFHSAQALTNAHRTGIHFVGKNHLLNTLTYLELNCNLELNNMRSPVPSTTNTATTHR